MKETAALHIINGNKRRLPRVSLHIISMIRTLSLVPKFHLGTRLVPREISFRAIRLFFLLLLAATTARASDPINAPVSGASPTVTQPHVTAELIPEKTTIEPGTPFDIALHLHADPGWHTYWINPGDAGLATTIKWTLPPGFTAGPIQWPTPEKHDMGGLITYGYAGDVYLLTTITPPKSDLPQHFDIKAKAQWLVCEEECVPGKADLSLSLDSGLLNLRLPIDNSDFFAQARERLPVANKYWDVIAALGPQSGKTDDPARDAVWIQLIEQNNNNLSPSKSFDFSSPDEGAYFFPEQSNALSSQETVSFGHARSVVKPDSAGIGFQLIVPLQQNGDKISKLSGVLLYKLGGSRELKSVQITSFELKDFDKVQNYYIEPPRPVPALETSVAAVPSGGSAPSGGPDHSLSGSPQATGGLQPSATNNAAGDGHRPPLQEDNAAQRAAATEQTSPNPVNSSQIPLIPSKNSDAPQPVLIAVLGAAFIGGLILNLMPCVLPVLSLKVFSLMKHAGENPKTAWLQGVAFTAGVVISFWVLAGLLLALRSAGNHLGWGFQMQSPGFVLGLILLFFLLALNLFGVFELGSSLPPSATAPSPPSPPRPAPRPSWAPRSASPLSNRLLFPSSSSPSSPSAWPRPIYY
jgi:DsbC/DsbD-like thiol-disulfide interchange protein